MIDFLLSWMIICFHFFLRLVCRLFLLLVLLILLILFLQLLFLLFLGLVNLFVLTSFRLVHLFVLSSFRYVFVLPFLLLFLGAVILVLRLLIVRFRFGLGFIHWVRVFRRRNDRFILLRGFLLLFVLLLYLLFFWRMVEMVFLVMKFTIFYFGRLI